MLKTFERQASNTHWIKYLCFSPEVKSFYHLQLYLLKILPHWNLLPCPGQPGQNWFISLPTDSPCSVPVILGLLLISEDHNPPPPLMPSNSSSNPISSPRPYLCHGPKRAHPDRSCIMQPVQFTICCSYVYIFRYSL